MKQCPMGEQLRLTLRDPRKPVSGAPLVSAQGLVFSADPSRQVSLDVPQGGIKSRGTEPAIVVDPAAYVRVEHARQIIQGLVTAQVQRPTTDGSADRLGRLRTGGGTERDAHAAGPLAHQPRPERVAEKVELEDRVHVPSVFISAIDNFGLVRMKRQSAVSKTRVKSCPKRHRLGSAFALTLSRSHEAMDNDRHSGRMSLLITQSGDDHAICS